MEKTVIAAIPRDKLPQAWPVCAAWLEAGLARGWVGGMTLDDVYDDIAGGRYLLCMIGRDAVPVAAVVVEAVGDICSIVVAGGRELESWRDEWLEAWERVAREIGARTMLVSGRPGWARELRDAGFSQAGVILEKSVTAEGVHP